MFNGINKLPHRNTSQAADNRPLLPDGPDQGKGKTPIHAHPDLAGRSSPSRADGAASMPPRHTLRRSTTALSIEARADAQAAFPGQRVRFAADASIVESGMKVGQKQVEFGEKAKPTRMSSHRSSMPVAAPAPVPPKPTKHHEPTRRLFGSLFRSHGHAAEKPAASPPPQPAGPSAAVPPHLRKERSPGQKFSERLTQFMEQCPDEQLKASLKTHIGQGRFQQFKEEAVAALEEHRVQDQKSFELMQLMLSSINKMDGDYSDVRIYYGKSY